MNEQVLKICKTLSEKSAVDIKIIDVNGGDLANWFIVCTGRSAPQVKAIGEHLEEVLEREGKFAMHKDGARDGRWIVLDYGEIIVHIFHKDLRDIYALDSLWNNGNNVTSYSEE